MRAGVGQKLQSFNKCCALRGFLFVSFLLGPTVLKQQLFSRAVDAAGQLHVRSALNPILWLCGIVSIPSMVLAATVYHDAAPWWLLAMVLGPMGAALLGFLFLLCFDRDRLQSESYQLKRRELEIIGQKGDEPTAIPIDEVNISAITEPKSARLPISNGMPNA